MEPLDLETLTMYTNCYGQTMRLAYRPQDGLFMVEHSDVETVFIGAGAEPVRRFVDKVILGTDERIWAELAMECIRVFPLWHLPDENKQVNHES